MPAHTKLTRKVLEDVIKAFPQGPSSVAAAHIGCKTMSLNKALKRENINPPWRTRDYSYLRNEKRIRAIPKSNNKHSRKVYEELKAFQDLPKLIPIEKKRKHRKRG